MKELNPCLKVLVGRELPEGLSDLGDEPHLDLSARELGPDKVLLPLEQAVEMTEMISQLAFNAGRQRRASITQPRDVEMERQRQHRRALRVVQPLHVLVIGRRLGRRLRQRSGRRRLFCYRGSRDPHCDD
jgi:hypothetical protein